MHYIIDGYNLLFYLLGTSPSNLKSQRESLIQALNTKIEYLALDVSLVFDSHLSPGEETRSHYHHLEVIFTPEGITADDYIINYLKHTREASKVVIVTNDRELALRVRHLSACTQNMDYFLNWLERRYLNLKRGKHKPLAKAKTSSPYGLVKFLTPPLSTPNKSPPSPPAKLPQAPKLITPSPKTPTEKLLKSEKLEKHEGTLEYYLSAFEAAHEAILQAEQAAKIEKKKQKKRRGK